METRSRKEIKEKEETFQARWKQREQELTAQLNTQAEARLADAAATPNHIEHPKYEEHFESTRAWNIEHGGLGKAGGLIG